MGRGGGGGAGAEGLLPGADCCQAVMMLMTACMHVIIPV